MYIYIYVYINEDFRINRYEQKSHWIALDCINIHLNRDFPSNTGIIEGYSCDTMWDYPIASGNEAMETRRCPWMSILHGIRGLQPLHNSPEPI